MTRRFRVGRSGARVRSLVSAGVMAGLVLVPVGAVALSPAASPGPADPSAEPMVSCGGPPFPAAALSWPGGAQIGTDAAARRLAAAITAAPVGPGSLPRAGWIRALDTPDQMVFIARGTDESAPEAPLWVITIAPGEAEGPAVDGWDIWAAGRCWPRVILPDGLGEAEWNPEIPVGAADTTFVALVTELACNSGEPATGRVSDPVIVMTDEAVAITFGVWPRPGSQNCPSNPPTPVTVTLQGPLGRRALVDGAFVPPRVVQAPPPMVPPGASPAAVLPWIVATTDVIDAHLGATQAIADSFEEGVRLVRVRIVEEMTLRLRLDALEDAVFDTPLTLCLVGPFWAPDDAGLSDRCWGEPDLTALVADALPRDASGRPWLEAGRPLELAVTLGRGAVRCDYAPGDWYLEFSVGGQRLSDVAFGVPWDPELPLPLHERGDSRYCGLANGVLNEQGEPPTPAP